MVVDTLLVFMVLYTNKHNWEPPASKPSLHLPEIHFEALFTDPFQTSNINHFLKLLPFLKMVVAPILAHFKNQFTVSWFSIINHPATGYTPISSMGISGSESGATVHYHFLGHIFSELSLNHLPIDPQSPQLTQPAPSA